MPNIRPLAETRRPARWFPVSSGLLTWEHYQRLGPAWLLFLWMIHEQRRPSNGEADTGAVNNGEPISYETISVRLQGMPARTIEKHVALLEREKYIRTEFVRTKGKKYFITNPIRWSVLLGNGESVLPKSGESIEKYSPTLGAMTPQNSGVVLPKLGEVNKEARTQEHKNKIKPSLALSSEVDSIYEAYPRKKKPAEAKKAIRKALTRLFKGGIRGSEPFADERASASYLLERTSLYARSPDGNRGKYTPYPASWFNAESYLENESEWSSNGSEPTKTQELARNNQSAIIAGLGFGQNPSIDGYDDGEGVGPRRSRILEAGTPRLLGKGN
ncbi:MAG TPA: hypothetical protein VHR84_01930 [Terriglobales bacterium]|jgi:hypothetical protein|nr:hypothetical protein [Terriglobales bacterium]